MPVMTKAPNGDDIVILSRAEYDALSDAKPRILRVPPYSAIETLTDAEADQLVNAASALLFWRERRKLSQGALAEEAEVPLDWIAAVEAGEQSMVPNDLKRIADTLEVSVDDLISGEII
jgi:hypothetical protein